MSTQAESCGGNWLVDLDGTLAHYDGWKGIEHIGEPVPAMLARVRKMLDEGKDVRIFTARIFPLEVPVGVTFPFPDKLPEDAKTAGIACGYIQAWCQKQLGQVLPITCRKDMHTVEILDDRATGIVLNRGISQEAFVAYHLQTILEAAGIKLEAGEKFGPSAERAAIKIRNLIDAAKDIHAHLDSARDALDYIKPDTDREQVATNIRQARMSLVRALGPLMRVMEGTP